MDLRTKSLLAIAMGGILSLLTVHVGEPAHVVVWCMLGVLVLWSLRFPVAGLLAALPMVYMIQPTPTVLGWQEIGFALVLTAAGFAVLFKERELFLQGLKHSRWIIVGIIFWVLVNFMTALWHGVPLVDWLRGIAPFIFILYLVPVWLMMRTNPSLSPWLCTALLFLAVLFSWRVLQVYISEELWEPATYIYESGKWIKMSPSQADTLGKEVFTFIVRVTLRVQQSTDVLLPLGVVWGVWGALWLDRIMLRSFFLCVSVLSLLSITLTYTRSMLLTAGITVAGLFFAALLRRQFRPVITVSLVLFLTFVVTIKTFNLESYYLNRLYQTRQHFSSMVGTDVMGVKAGKDANISTRIEEYLIAWDMFKESPVFGQGLGVRHAIRLVTFEGEGIDANVGYIHNWPLYMLMTGGIFGLIFYSVVLFGPVFFALRGVSFGAGSQPLILATVFCMALYGLFFAVFRLIPFNLILGGLWGVMLANMTAGKKA